MLFTVSLIIINSIYEGGIYLEIFRISFHTLRCESDEGSNHFTCKSRTRGTILRVPFKTSIEVLPACLDPHLKKERVFIQEGQRILICRNLAVHDGHMQFCNVTDKCVHYPYHPWIQFTASTDCNFKYVSR